MIWSEQLINLSSSFILLVTFAFLFQRKIVNQIYLLSLQGLFLACSMFLIAFSTNAYELIIQGMVTLSLKVILLPYIIYRVINKLGLINEIEINYNIPTILLVGIGLVIVSFTLSFPIGENAEWLTRSTLGISLSCVLISLMLIITRKKAITQAIAFLALENSLLFTSTSTSKGMPFAVELGIAFDVLIVTIIFGVFFLHIRQSFDSLDIHHLENLKDK